RGNDATGFHMGLVDAEVLNPVLAGRIRHIRVAGAQRRTRSPCGVGQLGKGRADARVRAILRDGYGVLPLRRTGQCLLACTQPQFGSLHRQATVVHVAAHAFLHERTAQHGDAEDRRDEEQDQDNKQRYASLRLPKREGTPMDRSHSVRLLMLTAVEAVRSSVLPSMSFPCNCMTMRTAST